MTDLTGIAAIIAASTALIAAIGGIVIQVITLLRVRETHDLVNGQSKKIEQLVFDKGVQKGGDAERANPTEKK